MMEPVQDKSLTKLLGLLMSVQESKVETDA